VSADLLVVMVPTTKLADSVRFYRDLIGLQLLEEWDDMGRGALLAVTGTAQIELVEMDHVPDVDEPRTTIGLKIAGVDAAYERLVAAGVRVKAPPRRREWGMYGFGTFDPNGVPVNVYEPAEEHDSTESDE
jgi:catechol 2,3-dioxygenase-like lactoylglutathione lyase family enzyme